VHLVVLAGLPGTGKSTVAHALAARLDAVVLDKDAARAALFEPRDVEYTREQDDFVVHVLLELLAFHSQRGARKVAVFDGRTFVRSEAREQLVRATAKAHAVVHWIECTCATELARERLAVDAAGGSHPAANRTPLLHDQLAALAEPFTEERLVLRTDSGDADELAERAATWLAERGVPLSG
jgi:predicted kinase